MLIVAFGAARASQCPARGQHLRLKIHAATDFRLVQAYRQSPCSTVSTGLEILSPRNPTPLALDQEAPLKDSFGDDRSSSNFLFYPRTNVPCT